MLNSNSYVIKIFYYILRFLLKKGCINKKFLNWFLRNCGPKTIITQCIGYLALTKTYFSVVKKIYTLKSHHYIRPAQIVCIYTTIIVKLPISIQPTFSIQVFIFLKIADTIFLLYFYIKILLIFPNNAWIWLFLSFTILKLNNIRVFIIF